MDKVKVSEKGMKVLEALQEAEIFDESTAVLSKEIAEMTMNLPKSVTGILNSLVKKELVGKTEDSPRKYFLLVDITEITFE